MMLYVWRAVYVIIVLSVLAIWDICVLGISTLNILVYILGRGTFTCFFKLYNM